MCVCVLCGRCEGPGAPVCVYVGVCVCGCVCVSFSPLDSKLHEGRFHICLLLLYFQWLVQHLLYDKHKNFNE